MCELFATFAQCHIKFLFPKRHTFPDEVVMGRQKDSWEFVTDRDRAVVDITISQPAAKETKTQFCVELSRVKLVEPTQSVFQNLMTIQERMLQSYVSWTSLQIRFWFCKKSDDLVFNECDDWNGIYC